MTTDTQDPKPRFLQDPVVVPFHGDDNWLNKPVSQLAAVEGKEYSRLLFGSPKGVVGLEA